MTECVVGVALGGIALWLCSSEERVEEPKRAKPTPPTFWAQQGLRPHVVLSTKFEGPWYAYSQHVAELLMELGCSVYNPNAESRKDWLLVLNENLEQVKPTKGFVLQIQQGATRGKSHMQIAEEMHTSWLQVPRIGIYAIEDGSTTRDIIKEAVAIAIKKAAEMWASGDISVELYNVQQEVLMKRVKEAKVVHLISTPYYGDEGTPNYVGAKRAEEVKKRLERRGEVCINPNEDFDGIAYDKGWTKEQQEKKWLEIFTDILLEVKDKKRNGSTVIFMCHERALSGNLRSKQHLELVGNAQGGELKTALGFDFKTEDGSMVFEVYS